MFNNSKTILLALAASLSFGAASANAQDVPPMTGAIPAQEIVTMVPGPIETRTTTSVTEAQITEKIKEVEKKTRTKVVFYHVPEGLNETNGCKKPVDPIKKGWIKAGGKFENTWLGNEIGWRPWKKGDLLCNVRISGKGKNKVITATIKRCGNKNIKIHFNQKMVKKKKVRKVTELVSKEAFVQKYFKMTYRIETTEQTTIKKVDYQCPPDYIRDGKWCLPIKRNPDAGAGSGNSGTPINNGGGAPDSGTAPSADCYARDGNDELVPGRIDPVTKQCVRV